MLFPLHSLSFRKFQSIGNDFVIVDLHRYQDPEVRTMLEHLSLPETVKYLCNRRTGIGADCLLVITKGYGKNKVDVLVYNADGSQAKNCLNGVRTIAHYLYAYCLFDAELTICIGINRFLCNVTRVYPDERKADVTTYVSGGKVIGSVKVSIGEKLLAGWYATIGNPHFVVFQQGEVAWLEKYGAVFQTLPEFPDGINISFVEPKPAGGYNMLVYERGCGITYGCSSGVAAATRVLKENKNLLVEEKLIMSMQGGDVAVSVDQKDTILLQAASYFVFKGSV